MPTNWYAVHLPDPFKNKGPRNNDMFQEPLGVQFIFVDIGLGLKRVFGEWLQPRPVVGRNGEAGSYYKFITVVAGTCIMSVKTSFGQPLQWHLAWYNGSNVVVQKGRYWRGPILIKAFMDKT